MAAGPSASGHGCHTSNAERRVARHELGMPRRAGRTARTTYAARAAATTAGHRPDPSWC
jgi:hypothetical protein